MSENNKFISLDEKNGFASYLRSTNVIKSGPKP